MPDLVDYLVAALLGALVGGTELVSRYRDAPQSALLSRPAWLYVFLNASASALALWLAMALFRTSLFTVRAGDRDVEQQMSAAVRAFHQTQRLSVCQ